MLPDSGCSCCSYTYPTARATAHAVLHAHDDVACGCMPCMPCIPCMHTKSTGSVSVAAAAQGRWEKKREEE